MRETGTRKHGIARWLWAPYTLLETNVRRPIGPLGHLTGFAMSWSHRPLARWAIEHLDVRPTDRVLDVGCGGGMAIRMIERLATGGSVAGLDYSKAMVSQARMRNRSGVVNGKVEVRHGSVMAIPFPDASFDKAVAIETLYYWPDPVLGLAEIRRVLRPGGSIAVVLEMSRESEKQGSSVQRFFSKAYVAGAIQRGQTIPSGPELAEMMTRAGFRDARYDSKPEKSLGWLCATATA